MSGLKQKVSNDLMTGSAQCVLRGLNKCVFIATNTGKKEMLFHPTQISHANRIELEEQSFPSLLITTHHDICLLENLQTFLSTSWSCDMKWDSELWAVCGWHADVGWLEVLSLLTHLRLIPLLYWVTVWSGFILNVYPWLWTNRFSWLQCSIHVWACYYQSSKKNFSL